MIAIIASPKDIHVRYIERELEKLGRRVRVIDTRDFGQGTLIDYPIGGASEITPIHGAPVSLRDISTVWYRRPFHGQIAAGVRDPEDRRFCRQEWATTFDGVLLNLDARFVNPVVAEFAAVKPRQLQVAAQCGFRIPDTLITNDPAKVDVFLDKHQRRIIHKALTAPANRLLATRCWDEADREAFDSLPLAPTMFQEQIFGPADIRATVVGDEIFAARIATEEGRAGVDSRLDLDAPYELHLLPDPVARALRDTMARLGLVYGTVDMKIDRDGDYVFLEINPQGQFLYVEILTGMPIGAALARLLAA